MLIKQREETFDVSRLEALYRRLPASHLVKRRIEMDLRKYRTGLSGEKEVDYPLSFLNEAEYFILHDIRLKDGCGFFQIDTLILCENYVLILEVKNWYGTILFGENSQVTRIGDDGLEEGFPSPILQAEMQQFRLRRWLQLKGFADYPVTYFVIISFPSTMIKPASPRYSIPNKVIHNNNLMFSILDLDKKYAVGRLTVYDVKQLAEELNTAHIPRKLDVLSRYGISKRELIRGVFCPKCSADSMQRKRQKWYCPSCYHSCSVAHVQAYNDYLLLIGNSITNREARAFLAIESPDVMKRLLQKSGFIHTGATKDRVYQLEIR